jgi:hypothetical protein
MRTACHLGRQFPNLPPGYFHQQFSQAGFGEYPLTKFALSACTIAVQPTYQMNTFREP